MKLINNYGGVREWLKSFTRNQKWRVVRRLYLSRFGVCEYCGASIDLNVHHIYPVRWYPALELVPYNLITMCREHHFTYGHFRNWRQWNPNVWKMAKQYSESIQTQQGCYDSFTTGKGESDNEINIKGLKEEFNKYSGSPT